MIGLSDIEQAKAVLTQLKFSLAKLPISPKISDLVALIIEESIQTMGIEQDLKHNKRGAWATFAKTRLVDGEPGPLHKYADSPFGTLLTLPYTAQFQAIAASYNKLSAMRLTGDPRADTYDSEVYLMEIALADRLEGRGPKRGRPLSTSKFVKFSPEWYEAKLGRKLKYGGKSP
jgi:hypothetical protein